MLRNEKLARKRWYKSKTIWFNSAIMVSAMLTGIVGLLPIVQGVVSASAYAWVFFGVSAINIVLRVVTNQGVE